MFPTLFSRVLLPPSALCGYLSLATICLLFSCMACRLLCQEVSDLALGKPSLLWLPLSASVRDALKALKQRDVSEISVWDCVPSSHHIQRSDVDSAIEGAIHGAGDAWHRRRKGECQCIGKVCMQRIICYLATDESLSCIGKALNRPLSVLLANSAPVVHHIDSDASVVEALDFIVDGAQNLVVAIDSRRSWSTKRSTDGSKVITKSKSSIYPASPPPGHNGRNYCWLTQEDAIRFLVNFISIFSPLPMMNIEELGLINTDILMVEADKKAMYALNMIQTATDRMTAVAVVEIDGEKGAKLIGEISPSTLQNCDETAALALATLSVGDFLTYVRDCKNPPDALLDLVHSGICQKLDLLKREQLKSISNLPSPDLNSLSIEIHDIEMSEDSSDDETSDSPSSSRELSRTWSSVHRSSKASYVVRGGRLAPIVCQPRSSLVAVMLQALAHRENYVWVTEEDDTLVGMVTFADIAEQLVQYLHSSG